MKTSDAPISDIVRKIVYNELNLLRQLRDGEISKGMFAKRWPCTRQQAREFEEIVDKIGTSRENGQITLLRPAT